ncbi:MAG: chromosome segregation protein SMC [Pseudomonadota bacterium]
MQFTKLRLAGFKSFVDPTELIIANGLTGVVGPNGCGKSNLLEALRWVMGENRPTAMRGGGMEDVIFAGAATRPARNFAEVSLILDNTDRLAPPAFNDQDMVEVVRRITRDLGGAYRTNGKDVRARDIQMLFADAATGAHSQALVRQGQIAELINAKPKARRRVLEEAAGISGLYQRRHEAELKLKAAEGNLARVDDTLEQLAQQLRSLERQAKQAARYRELSEEIRRCAQVQLFVGWRAADTTRAAAEQDLSEALKVAGQQEVDANAKARARRDADEALPPLREEDAIAAAVVQRLMVERDALDAEEARVADRIETLENRLSQIQRDQERELALKRDAGATLNRLEDERAELATASEGQGEREAQADAAARMAAAKLAEAEAAQETATEDAARLSARYQAAERRLEDTKAQATKIAGEVAAARTAVEATQTRLGDAQGRRAAALAAQTSALAAAKQAEETLLQAEAARATAQADEAETRAARAEGEGALKALEAEIAGLQRLLERDRAEATAVLDLLRVSPGFEAALGAALADDLKMPLIEAGEATGWAEIEGALAADLPTGVEPLSDHVSAPPALARRLKAIGVVAPDQAEAAQAALAPGQRLVSRDGDLWRWDGFRMAAGDASSAAALRLQQLNRLEQLRVACAGAEEVARAARDAHEAARLSFEAAQAEDRAARAARSQTDGAATAAMRALSAAEADVTTHEGRLETLTLSLGQREEDAQATQALLAEAEAGRVDASAMDALRRQLEAHKERAGNTRAAMVEARAAADAVRRDGAQRLERMSAIASELATWSKRAGNADQRIADLESREESTRETLKEARDAPATLEVKRADLSAGLSKAEARRAEALDALAAAERAQRQADEAARQAERDAGSAREARARAEAVAEAATAQVDQARLRIAEEADATPESLAQSLSLDGADLPSPERIEADLARVTRQRDALGAVNLRAEEDAAEIAQEHETLTNEKADLDAAIGKLRHGIGMLNREGRTRLLAAFDEVNRTFSMLFKHLFGGGEANLVMVESDDPLEAGLEIMCQPPGKKLSTLSLLSGGEQTLTALSLIFGVFLANPSPICVLDEVDAPLDDANVTRFCDLLDEMTRRTDTRFLIITHHAVTMSRMDRLFGVTMAEPGVSQLVSVDLKRAEEMVA